MCLGRYVKRVYVYVCSGRNPVHQRTRGHKVGQGQRRRLSGMRAVEGGTEGGLVQGQQETSTGHGARHPGRRQNTQTHHQEGNAQGHRNLSC